jgi:hypothetical protein
MAKNKMVRHIGNKKWLGENEKNPSFGILFD